MLQDDILLEGIDPIMVPGIFCGSEGMPEAMPIVGLVRHMPVIEAIIVEQGADNERAHLHPDAEDLGKQIAEMGDGHTVEQGIGIAMLDKRAHLIQIRMLQNMGEKIPENQSLIR